MHEWVVSDPKVMMGKPVIRGARITVESIEAIVDAHPRLTREAALDAIAFAADALKADGVYLSPTEAA